MAPSSAFSAKKKHSLQEIFSLKAFVDLQILVKLLVAPSIVIPAKVDLLRKFSVQNIFAELGIIFEGTKYCNYCKTITMKESAKT